MVTLHKVRFAYKKSEPLFSSLDFTIKSGGVYGLLGKNGAGKTTMLKLAAGLLFTQAGRALLFDGEAWKRKPASLARFAFVPEVVAVPAVTVPEFVSLYGGYFPFFKRDMMMDYLKRLEVPSEGRLDKMSLGQKKKALLAFAFSSGAELVFLDEPTNGLDIPSKQVFRRMVAESVDDSRAFVISTHQVRDVQNLIDPVVILHEGEIILYADVATIVSRLEVRLFPDEGAATSAGALSIQHDLGRIVALVPTASATGSVSGEPVSTEAIDLELLFQAALDHPDRMRETLGGNR